MRSGEAIAAALRTQLDAFARFLLSEMGQDRRLSDWSLDVICQAMRQAWDGRPGRLVLNAPPTSSLGHCAGLALPLFVVCREPTCHVLIVTGSRSQAAQLKRQLLDVVRLPRVRSLLSHLNWRERGGALETGHGGAITIAVVGQSLGAHRADLVVLESPLPPSKALDEAARAKLQGWYETEVAGRLSAGARAVVLASPRMHLDDLSRHLAGAQQWPHLALSAVALDDETWTLPSGRVIRRKKGEALDPTRESHEVLFETMRALNAVAFKAQYLQDPLRSGREWRSGWCWPPRPDGWYPGMIKPIDKDERCGLLTIRELEYVAYEVFGVGKRPPAIGNAQPYTAEELEQDAIIGQKRLVEACAEDFRRMEAGLPLQPLPWLANQAIKQDEEDLR